MLYRNLLIFTAIITYFLPTLTGKPTISREKAQEVFYQKTSFFSRKNAYHECYDILGQNPSFPTYNCHLIAEHLYRAQEHFKLAREYRKKERRAALSNINMLTKGIETCLSVQNEMEEDKKRNPELKNSKNFIDQAADLRNAKRALEDEKRKLEKKDDLYSQSYWQTLSDKDKKDLRWALEDGKLGKNVDEEMQRIEKDLKNL